MSAPDPDSVDPARPDPARPDTAGPAGPEGRGPDASRRPDLPDDVDAAFASIVADWAATGAPRWPDEISDAPEAPGTPEAPEARTDGPSSGLGTATPPHGARPPAPEPPSPGARRRPEPPAGPAPGQRPTPPRPPEDEHFVPPEPPPLPRLGLSSLLGLALLVVGVVLLAVPGLLGGPVGLGIIPGLLAMTAGLGWLVFGLRRGREPEGPDDGAVL